VVLSADTERHFKPADDVNWAMAGSLQSPSIFAANLSPGIIQRLVEDGVKIGAV